MPVDAPNRLKETPPVQLALTLAAAVVVGWTAVAVPAAVLIGRAIRNADGTECHHGGNQ